MASATLATRAGGRRPSGTQLARISPKVRAEILGRIRSGVPAGTAAMSCGVHRRTFQRWLEFGRQENPREPYRTFALQIEEAFADWQIAKISEVDAAGQKDWRSAAWMLERLVPAEFADKAKGDVQVNVVSVAAERSESVGEVLGAAKRVLTSEDFLRLVDELAGPDVVDAAVVEVGELVAT